MGKTDYKQSLNLPRTAFGMRANLSAKEPVYLRRWEEADLYGKIRRARAGAPRYVLHDGPPYPTGNLHIGTGMNKILKDIIVRFRTMNGFDCPFIPGWDCHGLPIEHKVMTGLGAEAERMSASEIRERCLAFALDFVDANRRQFKRLGCLGRWDEPYLTINPGYESGVIEVFAKLVESGYVYRQLKPIHWCLSCRTALAEAELEYRDRDDVSIHVGFELEAASVESLRESGGELKSLAGAVVLIWTTTPWTLPANRAVAVNPGFNYVLAVPGNSEAGPSRPAILALETLERTAATLGWKQYRVVGRIPGEKLTKLTYRHPLLETVCPIVPAEYVTSDEGTGCVHTAPGHGTDDYSTGVRFGLEVASPVDEEGRFTAAAGGFLEGREVFSANAAIVEKLSELGTLWGTGRIVHSYPHCWRCHRPVIFRATRQWFVSLEHRGLREAALAEVDRVEWVPEWGINRIRGMIEQRPDWCISRQRNWGIPIPAFYCEDCGQELLDPGVVRKVAAMFESEGADAWFRKSAAAILGETAVCSRCSGKNFRKENDIFDVWFESGSSHRSVLMREAGLAFPADLYLEGSDQHRGWFQLSLLLSTAAEGKAPFKTVLTHGFVVDENGEKMSKSRGNFISVDAAIEKYPADILRLWFASVDYRKDIHVSLNLIGKTEDAYRKIRNTFRHALGNIDGFDPRRDLLAREQMEEIDRWIMLEAAKLRDRVTEAYSAFEFHRVYRDIHNFCVVQMSSIYLDVLKDTLYTFPADSRQRRSCQSALWRVTDLLSRLLAPVLCFTAEEVWETLHSGDGEPGSVHLASWPAAMEEWKDPELERTWERLLQVREEVLKALEAERAAGKIGNSLEARVSIGVEGEEEEWLRPYLGVLPQLCIVSEAELVPPGEKRVGISPARGRKCIRCWKYSETVGDDRRHPLICAQCVEHISD